MVLLIVQHRVRDYRKWRRAYDAHAPARKQAGLRSAQVYRGADDSHNVAILFKIKDIDKAKAFAESDDLKKAMRAAGVVGKPIVIFVDAGSPPVSSAATPVRTKKQASKERPAEATADAWARFQDAVGSMLKSPPKLKGAPESKRRWTAKATHAR
jgi:hypothetical protein